MTKQNAINTSLTWISPTLQNSWVNYGGGLPGASYSINSIGQVNITGVIRDGLAGTIFNLPAGYRPKSYRGFRLFSTDLQAYAIIYPTGDVSITLPTNNNGYVYLDNIFFSVY